MTELLASLENHAGSYLATLGIGLMCSYLGIFTILRRIVFTGVALAQLAAAGVAASFFVADSSLFSQSVRTFAVKYGSTLGSLGLTVLGALGFETRSSRSRMSTDALVGIVFAASSALSILMVWQSARGLAELKNILAGDVLLSRPEELFLLWFGIIGVAMVHGKLRKQFLLVSFDPEFARSMGVPVHRLQMILMATLAIAIALSLRIAGLLLVFSFLVVPPMGGLRLGKKLGAATGFAMAMAASATLLGYLFAIARDLPIAASVAASQVLILLIASLAPIHTFVRVTIQTLTLAGAVAAIGVAVLIFPTPNLNESAGAHGHNHGGIMSTGPTRDQLLSQALTRLADSPLAADRVKAADDLKELSDSRSTQGLTRAMVDENVEVRNAVESALVAIKSLYGTPRTLEKLAQGSDVEFRILAARALVVIGKKKGIGLLIASLTDEESPPFVLSDMVLPFLRRTTQRSFDFDPFADKPSRSAAAQKWQSWWQNAEPRFTLPPSR